MSDAEQTCLRATRLFALAIKLHAAPARISTTLAPSELVGVAETVRALAYRGSKKTAALATA
jgi:hypothetical protein